MDRSLMETSKPPDERPREALPLTEAALMRHTERSLPLSIRERLAQEVADSTGQQHQHCKNQKQAAQDADSARSRHSQK